MSVSINAGCVIDYGGNSLYDLRRNDLARTTPSREAVQDHECALLVHRLIEVLLRLKIVNAFLAHCC